MMLHYHRAMAAFAVVVALLAAVAAGPRSLRSRRWLV